jgi:hypothetical protein
MCISGDEIRCRCRIRRIGLATARHVILLNQPPHRRDVRPIRIRVGDFFKECKGLHAAIVPGDFISEAVVREVENLKDTMGRRISIAASCTYESDNQSRLEDLVALGRRTGVPLLATNDVYYHVPGRRKLQDTEGHRSNRTLCRFRPAKDAAAFHSLHSRQHWLMRPDSRSK